MVRLAVFPGKASGVRYMKRLEDLKAFMMAATERTHGDGSINVDEISDALGIDREDGRNLARYLDGIGWARTHWEAKTKLWLTELGHWKVAQWRRPVWQQWLESHPLTRDAIMMTGTAIIAGIVYTVITYWLLKPSD